MAHHESGIRLVVTADDFGKSEAVNLAVETAHRRGIVTCASLMVTGEAFDQAVRIAKANPDLGVGLHLTLVCGRSCLGHERSTGLVDEEGRFADQPVWSGMRYFFNRDLRSRLADEIAAQFRAFERTGLPMDHVNGHLNIHLHPTVLDLVLPFVTGRRPVPMRLTRDPFWLNWRIASGNNVYRTTHAIIFSCLAAYAQGRLRKARVAHTDAVFGLLQTGRVDENYICALLRELRPGDYELYSHPSVDHSRHELDALVSDRVRELVRQLKIKLIRYFDL